jgi:membrane protease YdiL (CAAX protease family)
MVFGLAFPSLITWIYFIWLARDTAAAQQTAMVVGKTIQFVFPLAWVFLIRRERLSLRPTGTQGIVEGIGFGVLILILIVLAYHFWFKPAGYLGAAGATICGKLTGMGVGDLPAYVALAVFYSLVHSFLEEYYWRWFVYGQLRRLVSVPAAIAVSSLAFMAHHVLVLGFYFGWFSAPTVLFSLSVAVGGAYWAWLYQRSGSLLGPWLSHLLIDAAIFLIGYDLAQAAFY